MAIHQMQRRGYKALPLRRVYIPKSNGKKRPLGIPMRPAYCISYTSLLGIVFAEPGALS
jgi:RNA-directed DNA polymerase